MRTLCLPPAAPIRPEALAAVIYISADLFISPSAARANRRRVRGILRENKGFAPRGTGRRPMQGISCPIGAHSAAVLTHTDKSPRSAFSPAAEVLAFFSPRGLL
jgi:hypothetical protein